MARSRQHEFQRAGEMVGNPPDTFGGRDVVFLARLDVGRGLDLAEIDRRAVGAQRIGFDQPVVAVEIAQILFMPLGGQVGDVAIPVKQVEGRVILAQQVVVDHVVPDQVGAAQQVEGRRHVTPVEIAFGGQALDRRQLLVVDEVAQLARLLEIDLRGEEGRAPDLVLLAAAVQHRQRPRQRRSGHAIADRVDRRHVQPRTDMVDRVDLRAHVIVPHHVFHAGIGRFPADHEHGDALFDRPAHEAFPGVEVEDVEPVYPWREDDQRRRQHRVGRRRVLDQLVERGLVHHLARRHRDVLAQRESARVGMRQLPAPQIGEQVFHPRDEVFALRFQRAFHHHRVEQREIGRAGRIGHRPRGEPQLFALVVGQPVDPVDHFGHALGQEQIGLVDQRIGGVRAPARVGETAVAARHVGGLPGLFLPAGAQSVLRQHLLPHLHPFLPQRLLLRGIGQRHLAVPVLRQPHPPRRVHPRHQRLRIGQLLALVFQPHRLQLRPDLGPVAHFLRRQRVAPRRLGHRREQRAGEFRRRFEKVGEGVGAVVGHHRSCLVPSACWGRNRIFRLRMHARRLHRGGE